MSSRVGQVAEPVLDLAEALNDHAALGVAGGRVTAPAGGSRGRRARLRASRARGPAALQRVVAVVVAVAVGAAVADAAARPRPGRRVALPARRHAGDPHRLLARLRHVVAPSAVYAASAPGWHPAHAVPRWATWSNRACSNQTVRVERGFSRPRPPGPAPAGRGGPRPRRPRRGTSRSRRRPSARRPGRTAATWPRPRGGRPRRRAPRLGALRRRVEPAVKVADGRPPEGRALVQQPPGILAFQRLSQLGRRHPVRQVERVEGRAARREGGRGLDRVAGLAMGVEVDRKEVRPRRPRRQDRLGRLPRQGLPHRGAVLRAPTAVGLVAGGAVEGHGLEVVALLFVFAVAPAVGFAQAAQGECVRGVLRIDLPGRHVEGVAELQPPPRVRLVRRVGRQLPELRVTGESVDGALVVRATVRVVRRQVRVAGGAVAVREPREGMVPPLMVVVAVGAARPGLGHFVVGRAGVARLARHVPPPLGGADEDRAKAQVGDRARLVAGLAIVLPGGMGAGQRPVRVAERGRCRAARSNAAHPAAAKRATNDRTAFHRRTPEARRK